MKRRQICSIAYFYGGYLVIQRCDSEPWEAFPRDGSSRVIAASIDTNVIDLVLRSLTADPYVQ